MLILEAITIPIVMRSASIAEELSASVVTRGIDNPAQRTSFIQLKVHAKDWMVLCFLTLKHKKSIMNLTYAPMTSGNMPGYILMKVYPVHPCAREMDLKGW